MAEFEAITTQEAFDNAIKARLDRNTDTVKKQFEGYISPDDFKTKTADLNSKITDLTGKLAERIQLSQTSRLRTRHTRPAR